MFLFLFQRCEVFWNKLLGSERWAEVPAAGCFPLWGVGSPLSSLPLRGSISVLLPAASPPALSFLYPTAVSSSPNSHSLESSFLIVSLYLTDPSGRSIFFQKTVFSCALLYQSSFMILPFLFAYSKSSFLKLSSLSESSFWWGSLLPVSCFHSFSPRASHSSLLFFWADCVTQQG